jgi:hypothetical protein
MIWESQVKNLWRILPACSIALIVLVNINAQQPAASPQPSGAQSQASNNGNGDTLGDYAVVSSIEFCYRGLSVDGDHNKYRSDLNYGDCIGEDAVVSASGRSRQSCRREMRELPQGQRTA